MLGFGSLVLRLYFPSSGLFTQCYSNDFVELSSLVLYLTSVLNKSSLSTAEKFGAGFAELLSCWIISGCCTAQPSYYIHWKIVGKLSNPFKGFYWLHMSNYYLKHKVQDVYLGMYFRLLEKEYLCSLQMSSIIYTVRIFLGQVGSL